MRMLLVIGVDVDLLKEEGRLIGLALDQVDVNNQTTQQSCRV